MAKSKITQQSAAELMYDYFRKNRSEMPANIVTQRDFILTSLVAGTSVSETFAIAIARANQLVEVKPLVHHKIIHKQRENKVA